ncbi:50S ribosomal protein L25/general stress protein Ctc [Listeria sp. PSOL-1]|uniref:50S ribosomal protein L25/general stress protein Ctc n=1 Tax=Listeria sp. PSOL-1 TaxID=1844999 RepID=UPI0013D855D2|nr:50S ribosomal protein L25/general stress protein Ctc [Listeria sp. PSOL-1]
MATALEVQKRDTEKHSYTSKIREEGRIPAIVYGYKASNIPVSIDALELIKAVRDHGRNEVFTINVDGSKLNVLLHEYQIDPLKDELIHVDLLAVNMTEEVEAEVPVTLTGESKGVKEGGVLQQVLYELTVSATPNKLPETIEVDITEIGVGDSLAVKDISAVNNYKVVTEGESIVATVSAPRSAEETVVDTEAKEPVADHGTAEEPVE